MLKSIIFLILVTHSFAGIAATQPLKVTGKNLFNEKNTEILIGENQKMVIVFLSALCPCSDNHIEELKALYKKYPEHSFVGVHSNTTENKEVTQSYFSKVNLPFPIIQDTGAKLADHFRAHKTPHAFVVDKDGSYAYQGGVSSSRSFTQADKKYLRDALEDLQAKKVVRTPEGRTLGCVITRGGDNDW